MTTTLPLFWDLSSGNTKERVNASVKLISALEQFQAQFSPKELASESSDEGEDDDETGAAKADALDVLNAPDVAYSVRRLVRGLASPRESSRLGFAVALTEVRAVHTMTSSQADGGHLLAFVQTRHYRMLTDHHPYFGLLEKPGFHKRPRGTRPALCSPLWLYVSHPVWPTLPRPTASDFVDARFGPCMLRVFTT